jgi:arsenate reductase
MAKRIVLWHNPRCSKSRQALALLEGFGAEVVVRRYLDEPPSAAEIRDVLEKLGIGARELVRKGEAVYAERSLESATDDALVQAMSDHPILIERPVAIAGGRAVVGRPPERVASLLEDA